MYLNSKYTDEEVKECCKDLRVLNKSDFKMLLKWRLNILKEFKEELKVCLYSVLKMEQDKMISSRNTLHDEIMKKEEEKEEEEKKEEEEPKDIEEQLQELRERLAVCEEVPSFISDQLKNKREKKRLRKELNKKKKRALLGLDQMNVDIESQDIFDLNTIKTKEV